MNADSQQNRDDAFATAQEAFRRAIDGAYRQGRHSLALELAAFLKNATSDGTAKDTSGGSAPNPSARATSKPRADRKRGPNGIAGVAIGDVFQHHAGLSVKLIHDEAMRLGHTLSVEAIGAELRRHEGKKYRRENGRLWFPFGSSEAETAGNVHHD